MTFKVSCSYTRDQLLKQLGTENAGGSRGHTALVRTQFPIAGKLSAAVAMLAVSFLTAGAARASEPGWYLGASIGRSQYQQAEVRFYRKLNPILGEDLRDRGYEAFGGYQSDGYFALEVGYKDFGRAHRVFGWPDRIYLCTLEVTEVIHPCNGSFVRQTIDATAYRLGARATLPISTRFGAFALLGISRIDARRALSQTPYPEGEFTVRSGGSATHAFYGLGLRYQLTHHLSLRLQWDKFSGVSIDSPGALSGVGLLGVKTYSAGLEITL